ncbi:O-antigen ligase family protein [uncultured Desulfobacter sp.]|uniref:O-antigen ligase family protein n=1 Tax=uncultured Desulfobacter sp. TaxID=240139 RepID=UPI002AA8FBC4|nr:O-antigen ligase family protein [uncultured Desulfobacter sp.]
MKDINQSIPIAVLTGIILSAASIVLLLQPVPWLALLPPLLLPALLLLGRYPEYGYYLMVVLIPMNAWQGLLDKYQFLTISKLVGIFILFAVLYKIITGQEMFSRIKTNMWYPLGGFFLISVISTLYSNYYLSCIDDLRKIITAFLFFALTIFFIREKQLNKTLPILLITSTSFSAFIAVVGKIFKIDALFIAMNAETTTQRAIGTANDPNFYAAMILVSLPLIAHFFFYTTSTRDRIVFLILFIHNCYAVILTYSRAVMLVLCFTLTLILIEHFKRIRLNYLGFLIIIVGILGSIAVSKMPEMTIWERMMTLMTPQADLSLTRRASYIQVAKEAVVYDPLIGSGPGTFPFVYMNSRYAAALATNESGFARAAHNTYLEVLVGTGFIGFTLFLTAFFFGIQNFFKTQKCLKNITKYYEASYVRAMTYSFLSLSFSFLFLSGVYRKYLWLFLGLSVVVAHLYNTNGGGPIEDNC